MNEKTDQTERYTRNELIINSSFTFALIFCFLLTNTTLAQFNSNPYLNLLDCQENDMYCSIQNLMMPIDKIIVGDQPFKSLDDPFFNNFLNTLIWFTVFTQFIPLIIIPLVWYLICNKTNIEFNMYVEQRKKESKEFF